jgi:hypothetical protein
MKTLKNSIILLALVLVSATATAQLRFVVQNASDATVYESFASALAASQQGDTLYLPGGTFDIGNATIDKKITMIGVGHYPAYTQPTNRTELTGNINLLAGADTSQFHGFYLTGNFMWGSNTGNQMVNKITISRCNINNIYLSYASNTSTSEQILISENVVRGTILGRNAQNVLIEKNIVNNIGYFNNNALITNNVLTVPSSECLNSIISCTIQNNVVVHNGAYYLFYNSSANTVQNNLFVNTYAVGSGNIDKQLLESIFVNYSGGAFSYEHDFHLKETSPGKNAGTDGNDIGIYGTVTPYKEGAVPFNPHITDEDIATRTDSQGKLNVKVTVEAQNQ